ncbi:MAG: YraN family protein [bacterium]
MNKFETKTIKELNLKIGGLGEDIAKAYLENKGYKIIERNYRTKYAEIDIVAKKEGVLVFVEVRTKTGKMFGIPEETINKRKKEKLKRNAIAYMTKKEWKGLGRIDAVCIVLKPDLLNKRHEVEYLNHYENIC